ncbi:MAG: family 20 glycosylhydrolase [Phycisphaeraceae bacterium]|nr:family 20 glycosylhydrolase [Phycisphaeraceae bacterium]
MMKLLTRTEPVLPHRILHMDLKGCPPTPDRLINGLDLVKACGYSGLLIEWEDQFPWTVDQKFRGPTCYSADDVRRLVDEAARRDLELIPLVQCLGHMETVLRHEDYAALRELPETIDLLNPLAEGAAALVQRLIDDVLALMPGIKRFHLGGDEAWQFGSNPETSAFIEQHGKGALYLHHVDPLLRHLNQRGIRPMLWHDMMIEWDQSELHKLGEQADLVVWGYTGDPATIEHHYNLRYVRRFAEAGMPMWGATACKGADGMNGNLPDPASRIVNALAWVEHARTFQMKGLIATAWSRYSTARPQCDMTEAALDCMALVGAILHDGRPPEGGIEACRQWTSQAPGGESFAACFAAISLFSQRMNWGWTLLRMHDEQRALSAADPTRDPFPPLRYLSKQYKQLKLDLINAAEQVRQAYHGLTDARWIEEYLDTRVRPLTELLDERLAG